MVDTRADTNVRARSIATPLLRWYDRARRDLPWRRTPSPYRTLVSEFMLQQTVVATVIPHFERFLARWPDLPSLAAATEDQVLAAWSGLGYYARARNLHRAARAVAGQHGGVVPDREEALAALPGIGPYTAAAVAAIAFGRRTFALDGNAARVMARLAGVTDPIDQPAVRARLRTIGQDWVPAARAGDFVQAVMELGATVCTPRSPDCETCPLGGACVARERELVSRIPVKTPRPQKRVVRLAAVRLRRDGEILLVRGQTGLLAGTWMLPSEAMKTARGAAGAALVAAKNAARANGVSIDPQTLRKVGQVRHLFTHRDTTVDVFDVTASGSSHGGQPGLAPASGDHPAAPRTYSWVHPRGHADLALSTFVRKQLDLR